MPLPPLPGRGRPLLLALIFVLSLFSVVAHRGPAASSAPLYDVNDFERQLVQIVNAERNARDLPTLRTDRRLWEAIEKHAEWMAANRRLSHTGSGGSTLATRAWAEGYRYTALGEVLARGQRSPDEVVRGRPCDSWCSTACDSSRRCDGWKQSPGHWNLITSPNYRDLGVAYVPGPGNLPHWWGILFGNSREANQPVDLGGGTSPSATPEPTHTARPTSTTRPSSTPRPTLAPTDSPPPSATPRPTSTAIPPTEPPPGSGDASLLGQVRLQGRNNASGVFVMADGQLLGITSSDGRFRISGLPAGWLRLEVSRPGWLAAGGVWKLSAGQRLDLGLTQLAAGDLDQDHRVDFDDYRALIASYGKCRGSAGYDDRADFNADGCVHFYDFGLLYGNYGRSGPTPW